MVEVLRKVVWGVVGVLAGLFTIGFGMCAALGLSMGVPSLMSRAGLSILGLAGLGVALAWGCARLAVYSNRQIHTPASGDGDKDALP